MSEQIQNATLRIFFGSLILLVCGVVIKDGPPVSMDEYRLAFYSERLSAQAFEAQMISPDCNAENNCWGGWFVEYEFRRPNDPKRYSGSSYLGMEMPDRFSEDNLPQPIEVEYFVGNPSLNRAYNPERRSIWRVIGGDLVAVALAISFVAAGFYLVVSGFRTIWIFPLNPLPAVFSTIGKVVYGILFVVILAGACYGFSFAIRWLFDIPDEKVTGLPGIVLAVLLPFSLYLNVKIIERLEQIGSKYGGPDKDDGQGSE